MRGYQETECMMKPGEITEQMDYWNHLPKQGIKLGLANLHFFMNTIGAPQNQTKVIHVAGTNGKGSTSAFLANILQCEGYSVGRYSSPAVIDPFEVITFQGKPITREEYAREIRDLRPAIEQAQKENRLPTAFELETALAYHYFAKQKCDFAVIECGMGGDEDATNVTEATCLSVLTSIGMDHMSFLGNTIQKIAGHKAGIIKAGIPVVTVKQEDRAQEVIRQKAEDCGSLLVTADSKKAVIIDKNLSRLIFSYDIYREMSLSMTGSYQLENAVLALEAVNILKQRIPISDSAVRRGLAETKLPGRFEIMNREPLVIIDGAHNPAAVTRLKETIETYLKDYCKLFVVGVFADKDYEASLDILKDTDACYYTVPAKGERSLSPEILAASIRRRQKTAESFSSVSEALQAAKQWECSEVASDRKKVILCFGSLSYLKQVREYYVH